MGKRKGEHWARDTAFSLAATPRSKATRMAFQTTGSSRRSRAAIVSLGTTMAPQRSLTNKWHLTRVNNTQYWLTAVRKYSVFA